MEKNGYVSSFSQLAENGRQRTYYRMTEAGRKYYHEKCDEWKVTKEVVDCFVRNAQ